MDEFEVLKRSLAEPSLLHGNVAIEFRVNVTNILDSLYRKMPKKSFKKERKQELEILLMYYLLHDMEGDSDYWQEYLEMVLPALKKQ